ncbi:MAG: WYL domain-containing protein [Pirellulaceae bacterium]
MPNPRKSDRDRRVRQADRLARLLSILHLIQSRGQWNAKAIAQELGVTERTVYRDLQALEFAGVPYYFDEDAQSYRVRSDYRFPVPNLTDDEIIGQAVATVITKSSDLNLAGSSNQTTQKIAAASKEEGQQLFADVESVVSVLGLQLADHRGKELIIRAVQHALLQKKQLHASYCSPYDADVFEFTLHPIRLCLIKNAWYLIGQPSDEVEPRTYRIARFETAKVLEAPASTPRDFDIKSYFGNAWSVFRGDRCYQIRIRFLPEAARVVTGTHWHHTQQVRWTDDGCAELSFNVDGLDEISNWLLSWSGRFEVLEPEDLRSLVTQRLRSGLELNARSEESA